VGRQAAGKHRNGMLALEDGEALSRVRREAFCPKKCGEKLERRMQTGPKKGEGSV